jgi:hypothetical protein
MGMGPDVLAEGNRAPCARREKTVLNLVNAFAVAVKHYLRGEPGMVFTQRIIIGFAFIHLQVKCRSDQRALRR